MRTRMKAWAWLALAGLGWLCAGRAEAANPAYLDIDVSITANLSVAVNGAASSTQTVAWDASQANAKLVSPSSATVTNDSGGTTEKWRLSASTYSINTNNVAFSTWSLVSSTGTGSVGADQYAVQAVFGSSKTLSGGCPSAGAGDWDSTYASALTSQPVTYTSALFADTTLANDGTPYPDKTTGGADGRMFAGSNRALCWRIIAPQTTSTLDTQNVQVIVTALAP